MLDHKPNRPQLTLKPPTKGQAPKAKLFMQGKDLIPLSFSLPRRIGMTGIQPLNLLLLRFFALLGRFFALPDRASKTTSNKMRKSTIWASQNPFKIVPKCFQNRCPKKHAIFHRFLLKKKFVAQVPTSMSYWFLQHFLLVGHFSSNRFFRVFSVQKTFQNPSKTTSEPFENRC